MKAGNLFLTIVFLAATIFLGCQSFDNNSKSLAILATASAVLFVCAAIELYDDAKVHAKRRKRRATAIKMAGYERLRGGGWQQIPIPDHVTYYNEPIKTGSGPDILGFVDIDAIEEKRK